MFNFVSWLLDKQTGVYYIVSDAIVEALSITSGILILSACAGARVEGTGPGKGAEGQGTGPRDQLLAFRGGPGNLGSQDSDRAGPHLPLAALLGRPRRLRAWRQDTRDAGDEKLPILPDSTNSGDRYYGDE